MPLVASDIIQLSMLGRWTNGHPVVNVLHFRCDIEGPVDNAATGDSAHERIVDVCQNWQSQLVPEFRNNYTFEGVAWVDLRSADGNTGVVPPVTGEPVVGGSSGVSANPGDSLLVHKRTSSARGKRQGRMYLPPPGAGNMDEDGHIDLAAQNAMNTRLADFLANTTQGGLGEGINWYLVVLHQDGTYSPVTALQCDALVASQRRRVR